MSEQSAGQTTIYTRSTWQFWVMVAFLAPVAFWLWLKETIGRQ